MEGPLLIFSNWCRLYRNRGSSGSSRSMVVVVIYGCWLIRRCQSIVGRCGGKVSPFCRSWILVIFVACVITAITTFEVVIAAGLFKPVLVPPLLTVAVEQLPLPSSLLAIASKDQLLQEICASQINAKLPAHTHSSPSNVATLLDDFPPPTLHLELS